MSSWNWAVRILLAALGVAGGLAVGVLMWWSTPHVFTYLWSLAIISAFLWLLARVTASDKRQRTTSASVGTTPALTPFNAELTPLTLATQMPAGWCWQCGRRVKSRHLICYSCGATQALPRRPREQREQSAAEPRRDRPAAGSVPAARGSAAVTPSSAAASSPSRAPWRASSSLSLSPPSSPSPFSPSPGSSLDWSTPTAHPHSPSPARNAPMHQPGVPPPWMMPRVPRSPSPQGRPARERDRRPPARSS